MNFFGYCASEERNLSAREDGQPGFLRIAIRELQNAWRAHNAETLHKLRRRLSVFYSRNPRTSLAVEITGLAGGITRIIGE
jgi:hypothetical protein